MSSIFETDVDVVRSATASITFKSLTTNVALITTDSDHNFAAGWTVLISGVDDVFDGSFTIKEILSDTTFTYTLVSADVSSTAVSPTGIATVPAPAYVRYQPSDTIIDSLSTRTTFYIEPWDYNTTRIVWGVDDVVNKKVLDDVEAGLTPLVAVTRSAFGYPMTPLDGQKIFERKYTDVFSYSGNLQVPMVMETQPAAADNEFQRPVASSQSLYDRNLPSGRWYYYTLFFYIKGSYSSARWVSGGSTEALVPNNYKHFETFYDLIPPYYRIKDREFVAGTGQAGVLERLVRAIGFEADYTRTLAEGVENVYNVDYVHEGLLHALGETNMGVDAEEGLGDVRYRSLLATVNKLYDERGSTRGIQKLALASTKYNNKILEGVNMMNLTDDAEFVFNTGSWGSLVGTEDTFVNSEEWGATATDWNPIDIATVDEANSPSIRKRALYATYNPDDNASDGTAASADKGLLLMCGLGVGEVINRFYLVEDVSFYPQFHGIRCDSGNIYTFSFYAKRLGTDPGSTAANVTAGVMWFNLPANHTFDINDDFISFSKQITSTANGADTTNLVRYSVQSESPLSLRGEEYVYAVPYIAFNNSYERHIAACMFSPQLNSASQFAVEPDTTLTLGVPNELLGSSYLLG
jgi:hypothetical protein